ncbi:MAG: hypothetical protein ACI8W7_002122 [Gammaproteobacteria bacterium]|jgi:hypothetical protein
MALIACIPVDVRVILSALAQCYFKFLMVPLNDPTKAMKLLGSLPFVSRTFEGYFKDSPYVLDMDANLYIGPADQFSRDQQAAVEVVFHFLAETGRITFPVRELLRDRALLLATFAAFDAARIEDSGEEEFRIRIHGTYDGEPLAALGDDDLPAGPCGVAVNQVKLRFYRLCRRLDSEFKTRELTDELKRAEHRVLRSVYAREDA